MQHQLSGQTLGQSFEQTFKSHQAPEQTAQPRFHQQGSISAMAILAVLLVASALCTAMWFNVSNQPVETPLAKNNIEQLHLADIDLSKNVAADLTRAKLPVAAVTTAENAAHIAPVSVDAASAETALDNQDTPFSDSINQAELLALLPQASATANYQLPVSLWRSASQPSEPVQAKVPSSVIKANADALADLQTGDEIELPSNDPDTQLNGSIINRRMLDNGIMILRFNLNDGNGLTGGQIVQGKISTDINVSSESGAYTVTINNQTGHGTLINDADLKQQFELGNDGLILPSNEPGLPPEGDLISSI